MRLIIIDGLDAVGKDTHAKLIKKRYEEKGEKVVIRSHPELDNFFGRKAKKALMGHTKIDKFFASVFYMFDVLRSIKKYYHKKGCDTLIMVRYLMGTAYLPSRLTKAAYTFFENFVPTSDYMFFLDAPPSVLLERVKNRSEKEMFENFDDLLKVRKKALLLAEHWNIVDTSGSPMDTFSHIERMLDRLDRRK
ncbi:MAG: thymidylate kinase [Candidatus Thermoplasmatota archaeon]|jgi:dTMP kinase|nr:thymidylate kinase [Candidatus Thermoplasmatota archaeon]